MAPITAPITAPIAPSTVDPAAVTPAGAEQAIDGVDRPRVKAPHLVEEKPLVEEELLVEEVSIDGMCGVY